jgi:hypothetical protein
MLGSLLVPTITRLLLQRPIARATQPLQRDAMRFAGGGAYVELFHEDGRSWMGIVVDASFAGLAVQMNDASLLQVREQLRVQFGAVERTAVVRNIRCGQSGCGRVGLEWNSEETPIV